MCPRQMQALLVAMVALSACYRHRTVGVPAGTYVVGCTDSNVCAKNPRRAASVPAFRIDKYAVSLGEYEDCVNHGACTPVEYPRRPPSNVVARASVEQARQFCSWRHGRLPTDEEWEITARGTDERRFPWGNAWDDSRAGKSTTVKVCPICCVRFIYDLVETREVTESPFGAAGMVGAVFELVQTPAGDVHLRGGSSYLPEKRGQFTAFTLDVVELGSTASAFRCVYPSADDRR